MSCKKENCNELLNTHHYYCDTHWIEKQEELRIKEEILINHRMNDPNYIQDTKLFFKCQDTLSCLEDEDDEDDDEEEPVNWMLIHLHHILFEKSYKIESIPNRLTILIEETKKAKLACCSITHGVYMLPYDINHYECYQNFLTNGLKNQRL